MAKPILFIRTNDETLKQSDWLKIKEETINTIKKDTDNEYHIVFYTGDLDIKVVNDGKA